MNEGKGGMSRCGNAKKLLEDLDHIINTRNRSVKVAMEDYKKIKTEYALLAF